MRDLKGDHKTKPSRSETRTKTKSAAERKSDRIAARTTEKISASSLGRLNAARASAQAFAKASPHSTVGRISAYKNALAANDLDAAAEALAGVANKTVTATSVSNLNELLGLELDDVRIAELVDKVEIIEARTAAPTLATGVTTVTVETSTTPDKAKQTESMGRLNAAHASPRAMERASMNSPVAQIGAYKTALAANDLDTAAEALAKASNKPVTAETVTNLNDLLGIPLTEAQVTELVQKTEMAETKARTKASRVTR
jgi:hypothetical protein